MTVSPQGTLIQSNLGFPDLDYLDFSSIRSFSLVQFGHEYLLVTIKIPSHILFKTTALKGAVKWEGFCFVKSKRSAFACRKKWRTFEWVLIGSEFGCCLLGEISRSMAWKTGKLASRTFIHHRHVLKAKRSVLSIKDKNEEADKTVFQMICKNVLNVVFLI